MEGFGDFIKQGITGLFVIGFIAITIQGIINYERYKKVTEQLNKCQIENQIYERIISKSN